MKKALTQKYETLHHCKVSSVAHTICQQISQYNSSPFIQDQYVSLPVLKADSYVWQTRE